MPGTPNRRLGAEVCSAAPFDEGPGMDPRVSATSLRDCFTLG
jgi:hypothetical protein